MPSDLMILIQPVIKVKNIGTIRDQLFISGPISHPCGTPGHPLSFSFRSILIRSATSSIISIFQLALSGFMCFYK